MGKGQDELKMFLAFGSVILNNNATSSDTLGSWERLLGDGLQKPCPLFLKLKRVASGIAITEIGGCKYII